MKNNKPLSLPYYEWDDLSIDEKHFRRKNKKTREINESDFLKNKHIKAPLDLRNKIQKLIILMGQEPIYIP